MNRFFRVMLAAIAAIAIAMIAAPAVAHAQPKHSEAATTEPKHEESEAEENAAPAPINWADFSNKKQPPYAAAFLNFAIVIGIYYAFGKKPIAEGLKARRANVAREIEEAQRMKAEAEKRAEVYQSKLAHLGEELTATREALLDAGKGEKDRIVREAEEKATRLEKDAAFLVEQEMKQLRQDLVRSTVETAIAAAEDLLKKRITPADQERLAEEYLSDLARRSAPKLSNAPKAGSILPSGGAS